MNKENLSAHLRQTHTFQACKISKNLFAPQDNCLTEYFQEEKASQQQCEQVENMEEGQSIKQPEGLKKGQEEENSQQSVLEFDEKIFEEQEPNKSEKNVGFNKFLNGENTQIQQPEEESSGEDMMELWDQISKEKQEVSAEIDKGKRADGEEEESSCQLSEEEMQQWLTSCQNDVLTKLNRDIVIHHTSDDYLNEKNSEQRSSWGSLNELINQAMQEQPEEDKQIGSESGEGWNMEKIMPEKCESTRDKNIFDGQNLKQFLIDDSPPFALDQKESFEDSSSSKESFQSKYNPNVIDVEFYQIFENPEFASVLSDKFFQGQELCRRINQEIQEEIAAKQHLPKAKLFLKTSLIQYGKDFLLYDLPKFSKSQIKEGYHTYFGIQSLGFNSFFANKNQDQSSVKNIQNNLETTNPTDCLFFAENGECFIETEYPDLIDNPKQEIKQVNMYLSLTKEKIAVIERKVFAKSRDRRQVFQVRNYDEFQKKPSDFLAIIESKIGKFSNQWYCETVVYTPKKKTFSKKICEKNWNKFKMHLILSDVGSIVAELGIVEAKSSVTNCILYGENKNSQVMIGALEENSKHMDYILRVSGISPIVGFAAAISRKTFVNSG